MPPKRKFSEHPNVTIGRAKIAKREHGKRLVNQEVRNNILLYLENLKDDEAINYAEKAFESKLSSAVSGALDPDVGPESFIDLSKYRPDLPAAFGNKQAGQLMSVLLGMDGEQRLAELQKVCDEQKEKLEGQLKGQQSRREHVEETLAYLQELIPLSRKGRMDLPKEIKNLEALDPDGDSGWLYGILWTSCLQWMDMRMRQLRAFAGHKENGPKAKDPVGLKERTAIINARVHGGDLRADALLGSLHFGEHRHDNVHYDRFIKTSFKKMYQLSVEDGLWLARHGQEISAGVDWPRIIGFIDKFVTMADRVNTWFGKDTPENYKDVIKDRFIPLAKHVSDLIKQASADPAWNASTADLTQLGALEQQIYLACNKWIAKGDRDCLWDTMGDEPQYWAFAGYLRDQPTVQSRDFTQDDGTKKLRPQVRINYKV
ncbi:hypothetical protein DHEL01_v205681 [Diaporthe helianthi]|uniref:Uncharacterized protein n=1 Tax=Diaporthe helianthi TaxID=158607 RepID=A0A2P5I0D2_DIAHE|nr:hypothetical protein DHEL01_v205681 [Diaporthe helianthi]